MNEESYSFSNVLRNIPPFHVDEVLKNKMADIYDVQILKEYSTFIHESEEPEKVKKCNNFNPLMVDAVLKYGIEEADGGETLVKVDGQENTFIQLDNINSKTRLRLQLEDGEIDDYLKIYTNYVRVDDGEGDFHYDLYFNIQNLFNSPFEYISSVTN